MAEKLWHMTRHLSTAFTKFSQKTSLCRNCEGPGNQLTDSPHERIIIVNKSNLHKKGWKKWPSLISTATISFLLSLRTPTVIAHFITRQRLWWTPTSQLVMLGWLSILRISPFLLCSALIKKEPQGSFF